MDAVSLPSADSAVGALMGRLPDLEDIFPRLGTVAQLALLRSRKDTSRLILVCNTHLYFAGFARHIRVLQVALILEEAELISKTVEEKLGRRPALLFLGDLNSEPGTAAVTLLQEGRVSAAHPDWARCATFRWGHGSSRRAAREMLEAMRSPRREEAYAALAEKDGFETLRSCMERLQRIRSCLVTLGIHVEGEEDDEEDEPPGQADQALPLDASPWDALAGLLASKQTFKTSTAVACAQLALDTGLKLEPVLELSEDDLAAAKAATQDLAQVVKQKTEIAVEQQRAVAEKLEEESEEGPALAGLGLQLESPFPPLTSALNAEFTNFVGGYEACLDWILYDKQTFEKAIETD
ncbi:unnamed protein product [Effrenium voratum]|nr:unnamed protein product [Effrenium voratum]